MAQNEASRGKKLGSFKLWMGKKEEGRRKREEGRRKTGDGRRETGDGLISSRIEGKCSKINGFSN
ncbi:hypothetical protein [Phormidium nigroviride]